MDFAFFGSSLSPVTLVVDRCRRSRWSARSAARTNDLDVDKVDHMLLGGATRTCVVFQVMCCLRRCEVGGASPPVGRAGAQTYLGPRTRSGDMMRMGCPTCGLSRVRPLSLSGSSARGWVATVRVRELAAGIT
jgi:hypothetical protein